MSKEYESYIARLVEVAEIQQLPATEQGVLLAHNQLTALEEQVNTLEGTLENIQDDNVAKEGRIKKLEGLLAKQELVSEFYLEGIDKSQADIATLEAELEKHQWVDINERLPEEWDDYLCIDNEKEVRVASWCSDKNWWFVDHGIIGDITHWRTITLPESNEATDGKAGE